MTDIFNSSSSLDQMYQNVGFFSFICVIRTKSENIGSGLNTYCLIFYKTTIKAYLICS